MTRLKPLSLHCLAMVLLWPATSAAQTTFVDRLLAPGQTSQESALAGPPKKAKDRTEGLQHYDRGLVFARQGAWKEAESAFRNAEKKYGEHLDYQFATAYAYLKLHRPDDAMKRYSKVYKKDPTNLRALVGMAAAHEEAQEYRDAVRMWMRYLKMPVPAADAAEAKALLHSAQQAFAENYEIAENPTGGSENGLTPADERELGLMYAKDLASSGVPQLEDKLVNSYVERLCAELVPHAKGFPRSYEVYVLNSPDVQASTVPGYIFVYRGLLETVTSENQLAGVLAHEIGHSVAHHSAKKFTKLIKDEQQLKSLEQQKGKLAKVLTWMVKAGSPYAMLAFSREEEEQADRLAVHIAYDAGYDPLGLAEMFQMFESMSPSSRKRWDLMTRTHPFSIDRANATKEYSALLPARTLRKGSADFPKVKARLKRLPPPPEPGPPQRRAEATPESAPPADPPPASATEAGTRTFSITNAPFAGEIPADWVARKTEYGTIVYEGQKGTEAYEASVELQITPKSDMPPDLASTLKAMQDALSKKAELQLHDAERTEHEGHPAAIMRATYKQKTSRGEPTTFRHVGLVVQYPEHYVIMSFYLPEDLFEKYAPVFQMMVGKFHLTS
ncbi:MAG TPA: M48 family metalloprotease [Vicinamibacterales bacterium]|nr:M48 family metalloprotease [Vicinamibacterales bacterium]